LFYSKVITIFRERASLPDLPDIRQASSSAKVESPLRHRVALEPTSCAPADTNAVPTVWNGIGRECMFSEEAV
jgi:hypothetical protein